jgi:hypothetical protein
MHAQVFQTLCVALLVRAAALSAQPAPERIKYKPTCAQCRVELTKLVSFGSASDPVLIKAMRPARDSRGRYFAAAAGELKVVVFDSTGKYLTSFGRAGQGPGELGSAVSIPGAGLVGGITRILVGSGDSIFVFHEPKSVSVFAPDLKFARRVRVPGTDQGAPGTAAVLRSGFVLEQNVLTPELIGLPFHVLNDSGRVVRSFGGNGRRVLMGTADLPNATLPFAMSRDERSLWVTADFEGFTLREWRLDGTPLRTVQVVDVPWMHPLVYYDTTITRSGVKRTLRKTRPHATVHLAGIDREGRLWLTSRLPNTGEPANDHPKTHAIEVFDPRSGTLLLAQPSDSELRMLSADLAYTTATDADGIVTFTIWRTAVRGG